MSSHTPAAAPLPGPTGPRGFAYVRTSKDEQDKRSQIDRIERWLADRQLQATFLQDSGSRDLSERRPEFQKLLARVEAGEVGWIVVSERDRLGVKDAYEYGHFVHRFRQNGVQLWSVADNRDLCADDRIEPILASLEADKSQNEQRGIADRTLRAKVAAVRRGEMVGGKPPWGYDAVARDSRGVEVWRLVYETGHRRVCHFPDGSSRRYDGAGNTPARDKGVAVFAEKSLDPVLLGWVRKVFEWHVQGLGCRTIARMLTDLKVPALFDRDGVWIGPTVNALLQNGVYVTGVPHWNKQSQGRFKQVVGGQQVDVPRVNGRVAKGRKRDAADWVRPDHDRPDNAIIDRATWDAAQARFRAIRATPKAERRPRSGDLYLAGLVYCAECDRPMTAWRQVNAYRCSSNAKNPKLCRCNRTDHDLLQEIVLTHLERSQAGIRWLEDNVEHSPDLLLQAQESDALAAEFTREITRLWQQAKADPAATRPPRGWDLKALRERYGTPRQQQTARLEGDIAAKQAERDRLVARIGLLDDEAAGVAAARVNELTRELAALRKQAAPQEDRLDQLRATLTALLEQHRLAREALEQSLPVHKGEAVRRVIGRITVEHREVMAGTQRRSEIVGVTIHPYVGPAADFRGKDSPGPG